MEFACLHGSQRIQGHSIVRHSFSVKTSLNEFSSFCHQESGDDISIVVSCQEPINSVVRVLASGRSRSSCFVLLCVCFLFSCSPGPAARRSPAMDELLMVVLFSALIGVMIGSLGTVVIFWLCGALERKTVTEKVSPELKDATIQAEYTQATSDETSDFRQMQRAQTSFSYHLYIGTAETCYHLGRRCRCYPDWDNAKRGLTICEICRTSSSIFEIGQRIYVSEQGQRFHLSRFCRMFKSLR